MIPKAEILRFARDDELRETTVQKDYVLGWLLYGISQTAELSRWVFKGGTCLKKCFFETYRFSEDLDFTVPKDENLSVDGIRNSLTEVSQWVYNESGISVPIERLNVEEYTNKQGTISYQAKLFYRGPLGLPRNSQQRIKFDITKHEILVDPPDHREVVHGFSDALDPAPRIACYSVNEILAEKTRALYERQGRARDVYDLVHISRNFRNDISAEAVSRIAKEKFAFKGIPMPTVSEIVNIVDHGSLQTNWDQQLRHQLPRLPDLASFTDELFDAIAWWLEPSAAKPPLDAIIPKTQESVLAKVHFRRRHNSGIATSTWLPDAIRFAGRNRLLAQFDYHGSTRIVEPYSLRRRNTGNILLYAFEQSKNGYSTGHLKSYNLREIIGGRALDKAFSPKWAIEL